MIRRRVELQSSPTKARSLGKDHKGWKSIPQRGRFMLSRPALPFDFYRLPHLAAIWSNAQQDLYASPSLKPTTTLSSTRFDGVKQIPKQYYGELCSRKPQNFAWSNCDVLQCIVIETLLWLTLCNSVPPVRQPPIELAPESSRPEIVYEAKTIKS